MGITAMIPDMTIGQLYSEAESRWGEIWDEDAARLRILLIFPRKERKMMELHGDMIEHGQPVMTIFHRPRDEAPLLLEQGLDPRSASFQFVDISSPDLGPWMQQLISNEKWLRNSVSVMSIPFSLGIPAQRSFETEQVICFRHPSLPAIERYYLPFPPTSIAGKCFVSLPRRQAAELARQQAEVLGVGRLQKKSKITVQEVPHKPSPPTPTISDSEATMNAMMDNFSNEMLENITDPAPVTNVTLPKPSPTKEDISAGSVFVPLPTSTTDEVELSNDDIETEKEQTQTADVELPEVEEVDEEAGMSDIEIEFRELVNGLLAAGVEPSDMMDDPRWEDITERAAAIGFETWPVFLELAAMG
jgi:hypothetical protein